MEVLQRNTLNFCLHVFWQSYFLNSCDFLQDYFLKEILICFFRYLKEKNLFREKRKCALSDSP